MYASPPNAQTLHTPMVVWAHFIGLERTSCYLPLISSANQLHSISASCDSKVVSQQNFQSCSSGIFRVCGEGCSHCSESPPLTLNCVDMITLNLHLD